MVDLAFFMDSLHTNWARAHEAGRCLHICTRDWIKTDDTDVIRISYVYPVESQIPLSFSCLVSFHSLSHLLVGQLYL